MSVSAFERGDGGATPEKRIKAQLSGPTARRNSV